MSNMAALAQSAARRLCANGTNNKKPVERGRGIHGSTGKGIAAANEGGTAAANERSVNLRDRRSPAPNEAHRRGYQSKGHANR